MPFLRYNLMRILLTVCLLSALVAGMVGCAPKEEPIEETSKLQIWVTPLPQKSLVEAVVGDIAKVHVMVRPGQSPETYSPSVPQMTQLAKSDIYFGIGMPLERFIHQKLESSMPHLNFVQTGEWIEGAHVCASGCVHGDQDPHLWMDPYWMLSFVEQVRAALIELEPSAQTVFDANAAEVSEQLRDLDTAIKERLEAHRGRSFYMNHPSMGHFANRYGLVQKSIEQAGSSPSAKQIAQLVAQAKSEAVKAVFTQPEFARSSADILARALNAEVVVVDVLSEDYFTNMLDIADALERSFK